ncbi:E3 ubiquitin-protein ligase bre1 [Pleurotus pulmonarius]|nr:E3 ubiquitin-protein ligase bre1 [Pleurotus pulmonarius]
MESKKRPHDEDDADTSVKKRIVSDDHGSPRVNGVVSDSNEPTDGDNLEQFRKEAIYRRMKHYSREYERSEARVAELERRKQSCEAGVAIMAACWSQLVETIRSLVRPDDVPDIKVDASQLFELTLKSPPKEIEIGLQNTLASTRTLVTRLVQSTRSDQIQAVDLNTVFVSMDEHKAVEANLVIHRARVEDLEAQNAQLKESLQTLENRVERARSATVAASQKRSSSDKDVPKLSPEPRIVAEPSSPSPSSSLPVNGKHPEEPTAALNDFREERLNQYEQENGTLRQQLLDLQSELSILKRDTPADYWDKLAEFVARVDHVDKINSSYAGEPRIEQAIKDLSEASKGVQERLSIKPEEKTQIMKRDSEIARLREQRDAARNELGDRKQKEVHRLNHNESMKASYESRGSRLSALESQLNRYKARLTAEAGHPDLLEFLVGSNPDVVVDLKKRLRAAESRIQQLEQPLSQETKQLVESEITLRNEVREISNKLGRYERICGDPSLPLDHAQLIEKLQARDDELQDLRKQVHEMEQVEAQLSSEVERLSGAWETLDAEVQVKINELIATDKEVQRLADERTRYENKYYAMTRLKDTYEALSKAQALELEKIGVTTQIYQDKVQKLDALMTTHKTENEQLREWLKGSDQATHKLHGQIAKTEAELARQKHQREEYYVKHSRLEGALAKATQEYRKLEESNLRAKKEYEKQLARVKEMAALSAPQSSDTHHDKMQEILQCRICKARIRDTVITKCMHSTLILSRVP